MIIPIQNRNPILEPKSLSNLISDQFKTDWISIFPLTDRNVTSGIRTKCRDDLTYTTISDTTRLELGRRPTRLQCTAVRGVTEWSRDVTQLWVLVAVLFFVLCPGWFLSVPAFVSWDVCPCHRRTLRRCLINSMKMSWLLISPTCADSGSCFVRRTRYYVTSMIRWVHATQTLTSVLR